MLGVVLRFRELVRFVKVIRWVVVEDIVVGFVCGFIYFFWSSDRLGSVGLGVWFLRSLIVCRIRRK